MPKYSSIAVLATAAVVAAACSSDSDMPDFAEILDGHCPAGATWHVADDRMIACMDAMNRPHGPMFTYYESGPRRAYGEYNHGEIAGWIVLWHESGALKSAGRERDGKPYGLWRWWSEDGSLEKSRDLSATQT